MYSFAKFENENMPNNQVESSLIVVVRKTGLEG